MTASDYRTAMCVVDIAFILFFLWLTPHHMEGIWRISARTATRPSHPWRAIFYILLSVLLGLNVACLLRIVS